MNLLYYFIIETSIILEDESGYVYSEYFWKTNLTSQRQTLRFRYHIIPKAPSCFMQIYSHHQISNPV